MYNFICLTLGSVWSGRDASLCMSLQCLSFEPFHLLEVAPLLNLIADRVSLSWLAWQWLLWFESQKCHLVEQALIGSEILIRLVVVALTIAISEDVWAFLLRIPLKVLLLLEPFLVLVLCLESCSTLVVSAFARILIIFNNSWVDLFLYFLKFICFLVQ